MVVWVKCEEYECSVRSQNASYHDSAQLTPTSTDPGIATSIERSEYVVAEGTCLIIGDMNSAVRCALLEAKQPPPSQPIVLCSLPFNSRSSKPGSFPRFSTGTE